MRQAGDAGQKQADPLLQPQHPSPGEMRVQGPAPGTGQSPGPQRAPGGPRRQPYEPAGDRRLPRHRPGVRRFFLHRQGVSEQGPLFQRHHADPAHHFRDPDQPPRGSPHRPDRGKKGPRGRTLHHRFPAGHPQRPVRSRKVQHHRRQTGQVRRSPRRPLRPQDRFHRAGRFLRDLGPVHPEKDVRFEFAPPLEITGNGQEQQRKIIEFIRSRFEAWKK